MAIEQECSFLRGDVLEGNRRADPLRGRVPRWYISSPEAQRLGTASATQKNAHLDLYCKCLVFVP